MGDVYCRDPWRWVGPALLIVVLVLGLLAFRWIQVASGDSSYWFFPSPGDTRVETDGYMHRVVRMDRTGGWQVLSVHRARESARIRAQEAAPRHEWR